MNELLLILKDNKIKPIISKIMPLLEAKEVNRGLESGSVLGEIVLMNTNLL